MFQQSQGSGSNRGLPSNIPNQPSAAGGDANVFTIIQQMEAKVKQMEERIVAMENKDRSQEEQISQLVEENNFLRGQLGSQPQHQPIQS